jgi:hypothetical protein
MRISKLIGALLVILALGTVVVAVASAAEILWKWLPGSAGETLKGKVGKFQLLGVGGASYICTKGAILLTDGTTKASSELLKEGSTEGKDATLALVVFHLEGCTWQGDSVHSDGDASGIILVHYEVHNCMITKGDFGLLIKPLPLHLEVPVTKLLELIRGSYLALIEGKEGEKALTFKLNIKQKEGKQELEKCEGGEKETLERSVNGGAFEQAGVEAQEPVLEFDMTKDTAGEEMMEK